VNGRRVAAARTLNRDASNRVAFGEVATLANDGTSTYPVLAATDHGVIAVWTTGGESSVVRARALHLR
jgi:hypothetical protein